MHCLSSGVARGSGRDEDGSKRSHDCLVRRRLIAHNNAPLPLNISKYHPLTVDILICRVTEDKAAQKAAKAAAGAAAGGKGGD